MNRVPIPRPSLDPSRREDLLREVLDDAGATPGGRRWLPPSIAVLAVGAVIVGSLALAGGDQRPSGPAAADRPSETERPERAERPSAEPSPADRREPAASPSPERTVPLDLGRLSPSEIRQELARCLPRFDRDPADYRARYARLVDGPHGASGVVIAENPRTGHEYYCSRNGEGAIAGPGTKSSNERPDPAIPIVYADAGAEQRATDTATGLLEEWMTSQVYRVSDRVDRVEVRVGTDDHPGVWRVAPARGGYIYTAAWFMRTLPADETLWLETRAFDLDGQPIESDLMGRRPVGSY